MECRTFFHLGFKLRVPRGEKTEDGSPYSTCVAEKAKGEGQIRVFDSPLARDTKSGSVEASVQKSNHDKN